MIDVEREFPGPYMWLGRVISRSDPEGLYRIKAMVPEHVNESDWAFPFGFVTGPKRGGGPHVPKLGEPVLLLWEGGHVNNSVFYTPVGFSRGQVPTGTVVSDDDDNDNFIWQNERMRVEIDDRDASAGLRITNLDESGGTDAAGTDVDIELDFVTKQVEISTVLGINIRSTAVDIEAGMLTLNGRLVVPGEKPI